MGAEVRFESAKPTNSAAEFRHPFFPLHREETPMRVSTDTITPNLPFRIYVQHEYGVNYIDVEP